MLFFRLSYLLKLVTYLLFCMICMWRYMLLHDCRAQRTALWSFFAPSTFMWILGIELGSWGLYSKHLYLPSHLISLEAFFLKLDFMYVMCMSVLLAYLNVHHVHTGIRGSQRRATDRPLGTGFMDGCAGSWTWVLHKSNKCFFVFVSLCPRWGRDGWSELLVI